MLLHNCCGNDWWRQTASIYGNVSFSVTSITLILTAVERNMSHNLLKFGLKIFFKVILPDIHKDKSFNSIMFFPFPEGLYDAVVPCYIQTWFNTWRIKCVENWAAIFSFIQEIGHERVISRIQQERLWMSVVCLLFTDFNLFSSCSDELCTLVKCVCFISNIIFHNHHILLSQKVVLFWIEVLLTLMLWHIDGYSILTGMFVSIDSLIAGKR